MLPMGLLENFMAKGVRLSLDEEENIQIRGNTDNLSPELIAEIKELKADLVSILLKNLREKVNLDISLPDRSKNILPAIKFSDSLNEPVLEKVFTTIVECYKRLRTSFSEDDDGRPYQAFKDASGFEVFSIDIPSLEPAQREPVEALRLILGHNTFLCWAYVLSAF